MFIFFFQEDHNFTLLYMNIIGVL